MKKLIVAIMVFVLTSPVMAENRGCRKLKIYQKEIVKLQEDLLRTQGLHQAKIQADEIKEILIDADNDSSVLNEKERKIVEKAAALDALVGNQITIGASTGATVLMGYMVWRMAMANKAGNAYGTVRAYFSPPKGKGKVVRFTSAIGLGISLAYAFFHGKAWLANNAEVKMLTKLIEDLGEVAEQSERILSIKKNIGHFEGLLDKTMGELFEEEILEESENGRLMCDGIEIKLDIIK